MPSGRSSFQGSSALAGAPAARGCPPPPKTSNQASSGCCCPSWPVGTPSTAGAGGPADEDAGEEADEDAGAGGPADEDAGEPAGVGMARVSCRSMMPVGS
ncbi:hypothetical protein GCM10009740_25650 [Terrabacter terrae]|uniref:Uncharacterized protein n=1 Tax=Terrabacter terrae TaxID=318434 RepID=A0ABN2UED9_9MICO